MASKLKVLHLIRSLNRGGCEQMLLRTLPHLPQFSHHILTIDRPGELTGEFRNLGISVTPLISFLNLKKDLKNIQPDVIITYLFHADLVGRVFITPFTRYKVVPFLRTTYNSTRYLPARIFEWLTKPLVSHYLANSQAVKDYYVSHLGVASKKITVIPNAIDQKSFSSVSRDLKLRRSLGISDSDFVFICVANFHPNKGHLYLLKAFKDLSALKPSLKLLLVGNGKTRHQFPSKVVHLGSRKDVPQLLKISDAFVLPTLFEGMSNAILEAMAIGLPVITTNIPENLNLCQDEKTALLVRPMSVSDLKIAMSRISTDQSLREALGQRAKALISHNYAFPRVVKLWESFLNNVS